MADYKLMPADVPEGEISAKVLVQREAKMYSLNAAGMFDSGAPKHAQTLAIVELLNSFDEYKAEDHWEAIMAYSDLRASNALFRAAELLPAEPVAGEDVMVNTTDVYTLPLRPSGLELPRFVVHVPDAPPTPSNAGYTHSVPDDCETLHWRGQVLSMNELQSIATQLGQRRCPHCDDTGIVHLAEENLLAECEHPAGQQPQAAIDILAERRRQINAEGWTPEHDDKNGERRLGLAAACYALSAACPSSDETAALLVSLAWPWPAEWWKPTTPRRDLVKAGALILAEIERLDRAALRQEDGK